MTLRKSAQRVFDILKKKNPGAQPGVFFFLNTSYYFCFFLLIKKVIISTTRLKMRGMNSFNIILGVLGFVLMV